MKFDKSVQSNNAEDKTIDITELLKVLWLRKEFIALIMLISFMSASFLMIMKAPIYQPTALIQVNNQGNSSSGLSSLFGSNVQTLGLGTGGPAQASQSQIEMALIQSNYILEPTVHKLNLDVEIQPKYFPFVGAYMARHYSGIGVAPAKMGLSSFAWGGESWSLGYFVTPISEYNQKFKVIMAEGQTYQLFNANGKLVLTGCVGQPAESQDGAIQIFWNALSLRPGETLYLTKSSLTSTVQGISGSLQLTELSPQSGAASVDTGLVQLALKGNQPEKLVAILNTIVNLTSADNLKQKELPNTKILAFIQQQLPQVQEKLKAAETRLHQQEAKTGVIDLEGQAGALMQAMGQLETQIAITGVNQAQYKQMYTNENPVMQGINAQVASLQKQKLQLQQEIATLPMRDQEGLNLMQDVTVQKQVYMALLTSEQQYQLVNASTTGDVRILNLATVPDEPLPQRNALVLFAALFVGLILGSLIVLIWHQVKNVVTDAYWAEKEFGIRTVAILPFSKNQNTAKKAYDEGSSRSIDVLAVKYPEDPCVESIRSLRTSLFFALKEKQANIVNITGVIPSTGKSFISLNLAVILAQTGKRVVLIDADMRRGYLHRYFKLSHAPGLSEVLAGIHPLANVIHNTNIENLSFIATGIYPDNPSELLLQDKFKETLKILEAEYDIVVVDSPPILAVNDASIIAKEIPINYLVIPGGQLKPQELDAAVRRFYNDGVSLGGSIFNFAKQSAEKLSVHSYHSNYTKHYQKDTEQQKRI